MIHIIMLIVEIALNNKINMFDSFLLKSTYNNLRYQAANSKYDTSQTIHNYIACSALTDTEPTGTGKRYQINKLTKINILSHVVQREEFNEIKTLLTHYRYSELPSPTNELNLVKSEPKKYLKDPRKTQSYPTSPRAAKNARIKWEFDQDEANIDWNEPRVSGANRNTKRSIGFINEMGPKARMGGSKHTKKSSELYLISNSGEGEMSSAVNDSSQVDDENKGLANRAINNAIDAQESSDDSSEEEESGDVSSSRSTEKANRNNISNKKISPNNHYKLTRLKREIHKQRRICEKKQEQNGLKLKEKKELELKVQKLKDEINDLINGATDTKFSSSRNSEIDPNSIEFIEQKGEIRPETHSKSTQSKMSDIYMPIEDQKNSIDDFLRRTVTSEVETDYWQKVNHRGLGTAAHGYRMKPLEGFDEQPTTKKQGVKQYYGSTGVGSRGDNTPSDFFGPNRAFNRPLNDLKKSIDSTDSKPLTGIENSDFFGNVLPSTMNAYTPDEFRITSGEDDLNNRLPDLNKRRAGSYYQGALITHPKSSLFHPPLPTNKKSLKGSKPTKGSKTARALTPSYLPSLTPRRSSNPGTNRGSQNTSLNFRKQDLDITSESQLERAYKNILPGEVKMLADFIEIRNVSRPSSSSIGRKKRKQKNFFKKRFGSIEKGEGSGIGESPRVTPMERRLKNKVRKSNKTPREMLNKDMIMDYSFQK